jgi:hypothetical protein
MLCGNIDEGSDLQCGDYKSEYRKRYEKLLRDGSYYHWRPVATADGGNCCVNFEASGPLKR